MKMKLIAAVSLLAASSLAMAENAVELTAAEMDGVTAGAASGLTFNLIAIGGGSATTFIQAVTEDVELANVTVQLTSISQTGSGVAAAGFAQSF
jgi:hypothetical protein